MFLGGHQDHGEETTAREKRVGPSPQLRKYNCLRTGKKRLISVSASTAQKKGHILPNVMTFLSQHFGYYFSWLSSWAALIYKLKLKFFSKCFSKLLLQET